MEIFNTLMYASGESYLWCWENKEVSQGDLPSRVGTAGPLVVVGFPVLVTAPLCGILPGTPFLLGVILSPIDGLITLGSTIRAHTGVDARARRKLGRALKGQRTLANRKTFGHLIDELTRL